MNETLISAEGVGSTRTSDPVDLETVMFDPEPPLADYQQAMELANREAKEQLGEVMLLSWYDRDRDFESPQHVADGDQHSAVPGYMDYGMRNGAKLMIDIHMGRFIFFYLPLNSHREVV